MDYFNNVFKKKLKEAHIYEKQAAIITSEYFNDYDISFNFDNKYDFVLNNKQLKFEVKYDDMSNKTNNYFIEYESFYKLSGISVSISDYYILTNSNNYYMIETKKLKQLIKDKKYKFIRKSGDNVSNSTGYIFDINIINNESIKLK